MGKVKLLLMTVMVFGLTLGLAGMASAAQIYCGDCHGAETKNPTYEAPGLPVNGDKCDNTGRGLHGIHNNYSSATYVKSADGAGLRGNCLYCHTAYNGGHPSATHINGLTNITGGSNTVLHLNTVGMSYNSGNKTCTSTCHRNKPGELPVWGNYTNASVKLSCSSCHDDITTNGAALSGVHNKHLLSTAHLAFGGATTMTSGNDKGCVDCHTQNANETGKVTADSGATKAYPHASDGTYVQPVNAALQGQISGSTPNNTPSSVTCTATCHRRSNLISPVINWASAMSCNMCHYYPSTFGNITDTPTVAGNDLISTGKLPGAHDIHFSQGYRCNKCHLMPPTGDTAHITFLPVSTIGVTYVAGLGYSGSGRNGTCVNSCHLVASASWSETTAVQGCAACHAYPGGVKEWSGYNGHMVRFNGVTSSHLSRTNKYNALTDSYGTVTGNNSLCGKCHGGGTHMAGRVVKNAASGYNYCTGSFSIISTATNITCSNVSCHSGRTTPNWW